MCVCVYKHAAIAWASFRQSGLFVVCLRLSGGCMGDVRCVGVCGCGLGCTRVCVSVVAGRCV